MNFNTKYNCNSNKIHKNRKISISIELFLFYSIIGWLYEEILEVFIYKSGFTNRGFLFGPYLPIYGFGALLLLSLFYPMKKKQQFSYATPFAVFLGGMIMATLVELLASYALSYFNLELWNYNNYPFNFQGRIALNPSIRFGLGSIFFLYVLQPIFDKIITKQSNCVLEFSSTIILLIISFDFLIKLL